MQDPELDYRLRRSCKKMIKVCLSVLVFTGQQFNLGNFQSYVSVSIVLVIAFLSDNKMLKNKTLKLETKFRLIPKPWFR